MYQQPSMPQVNHPLQPMSVVQPIIQPTQVPQEEEETGWKTVINKKHVKFPEEVKARKQPTLSDYWLQQPIETGNVYDKLPQTK